MMLWFIKRTVRQTFPHFLNQGKDSRILFLHPRPIILLMVGYTADEMASVLGDGWERGTYGSQGDGWKFLKKGDDISVFYHPEGGTHGGEYWGISSGETGKIKVVDPNTYIPGKDDHATIIYR